jgi:hypothetical protein
MLDRISSNSLNPLTMDALNVLSQAINEGNYQGCQQAFREITQKNWGDVKDYSNALKTIANFKQKY